MKLNPSTSFLSLSLSVLFQYGLFTNIVAVAWYDQCAAQQIFKIDLPC